MQIRTREKFIKYINRAATMPSGRRSFTPYILVDGIIDKLDSIDWSNPNLRILDPCFGFGSFLFACYVKLKEFHTEEHILNNMLFGIEIEPFRYELVKMNFAIKHLYKEDFLNPSDELKKVLDMKFDCIIGNPPYQSGKGNGSQPIYKKFITHALTLTKENGYVSIISPPGHLSGGNLNTPNKIFENIKQGNLQLVQYEGVADHFRDVGSLFCYMIWQNSSYGGTTLINGEAVDISDMNLIPPRFTSLGWNIIKKITNTNTLDTLYRKRIENHNWVVGFKELNHVNNKLGNLKAKVFSPNTFDTTYNFAKVCINEEDAIYISSYLNGYIGSFYNYFLRHNGVIHNGIISRLSVPPVGQNSYSYFNLTQEEIDYIEINVK